MKTFGRSSRASWTPKGDNTVKASIGDYRTHAEGGENSLNRDNDAYLAPVGYKLGMHGPRNKTFMPLSPNENDNTHFSDNKIE